MSFQLKDGFGMGGAFERVISPALLQTGKVPALEKAIYGTDEYWMQEALLESLKGIGITSPNPSVGCVIVKEGKEIARGHTEAYRGRHAERVAMDSVSDHSRLEGATAYVTLEPCSHFGNQPPCANLLAESGISRIVVGRLDTDPRVQGRGLKLLRDVGKTIQCGVLEDEITAFNLPFFSQHLLKRPVLALKWAQTLDGQLADDLGYSQWISNGLCRSYTHWLRQKYDAILVGAGTYLADLPKLTARDCAEPIQSQPLRIVLDPKGRLFRAGLKSSQFEGVEKMIVLTTVELERIYRNHELSGSFHLLAVPGLSLDNENLGKYLTQSPHPFSEIIGKPLQSILVEGGPGVLNYFLREGFADILHVFVSPQITGGIKNRIHLDRLLGGGDGFRLVTKAHLGDDTLLELVSTPLQGLAAG